MNISLHFARCYPRTGAKKNPSAFAKGFELKHIRVIVRTRVRLSPPAVAAVAAAAAAAAEPGTSP
jgi:hypothetical protein